MKSEKSIEDIGRGRKPVPQWQRWIAGYAIIGVALYTLAYLPVRPYRPFCDVNSVHVPVEYYGPHLNERHRRQLSYYLNWTDTLYFEIGDMIFVPLVERGYDDPKGMFELLLGAAFSSREWNWRQANGKIESGMPFAYARDHPNSDIAELHAIYKAKRKYDEGSSKVSEAMRLKCELIKAVIDPNLD